jgi:REP element-mobilizing transposase RayT
MLPSARKPWERGRPARCRWFAYKRKVRPSRPRSQRPAVLDWVGCLDDAGHVSSTWQHTSDRKQWTSTRLAHRGWHTRGYLPHFDSAGVTQMVTYRLDDALPTDVIARCGQEARNEADRRKRLEAYLDAGLGSCALRRPEAAQLVVENWKHFDGTRYFLRAWVVMPNHVHVMITQQLGWPLDRVVHGWKSFTAHEINRLVKRSGRLWEPDYWDRGIRDERHNRAAVAYIHNNPVKAGLTACAEGWPWSSAHELINEP